MNLKISWRYDRPAGQGWARHRKGLQSWRAGILRCDSESEVAQSCPTLCDLMDCSLPSSSVHGILQARILEWVAISLIWLHLGTVSFTLTFVPYCFCYKLIMLPTAGHIQDSPCSRLWRLTIQHFPIHFAIRENNIYLVGGLQECRDLTNPDGARTKDSHQQVYNSQTPLRHLSVLEHPEFQL